MSIAGPVMTTFAGKPMILHEFKKFRVVYPSDII